MTRAAGCVAVWAVGLGACGAAATPGMGAKSDPGAYVTFVEQGVADAVARADRVVASAAAAGCRVTNATATIRQMDCPDGSFAVNAAGEMFVGVCPPGHSQPSCQQWFAAMASRAGGAPAVAPGAAVVPSDLFGPPAPAAGEAPAPAGGGIKIED